MNTPTAVTTYEQAITLLKKAVKDSIVEKQRHIDLTVVAASERPLYDEAMIFLKFLVRSGKKTDDQIKHDLGLS